MAHNGDDRSVKARDITGSQVITGDQNTVSMSGVTASKVELPAPETVDPRQELAELRAVLTALQTEDAGKIDRALADAEEEAAKPEPDRDEIGVAVDRALGYAKKANDFGEQVAALTPRVKALASWLGSNWHKILAVVGLGM